MKISALNKESCTDFTSAALLPRNFKSAGHLPSRESSVLIPCPTPLTECDLSFFYNYDIFPRSIMTHKTQWGEEARPMRRGDLILQRVVLPPAPLGLRVDIFVRISEVVEESDKVGFSYETLSGHLEMGVASFSLTQEKQAVRFIIHTLSRPGHWVSIMATPITLFYQRWCTKKALCHVQRTFASLNPPESQEGAPI